MALLQDSVEMQEREAGRTRTPKTLMGPLRILMFFFPPEAMERFLRNLSIRTKIMASGQITSWQKDRETMEKVRDFIFLVSKSLQMVTAAMKLKDTCSLEEKL